MVGAAHPLKRLLILGSGGRLGAALARIYSGDYEVTGLARRDLDFGSNEAIRQALDAREFDLVINCAALTNVDYCETNEAEAYQINARAVGAVAEAAARKGARVIHISTDYVFDGLKTTPYTELDEANPVSIYGGSKRQGEIELLAVSERNLAVRVAWVFGPDRPSFVDAILKNALQTSDLAAVDDKLSAPTFTLDAAALLRPLFEESFPGGVLHLCNAGACSWREYGEFAVGCLRAAGIETMGSHVRPLRLADMGSFVAKRPPYTVLSTEKLTRLSGLQPRPWQEAVADYVTRFVVPQFQSR